MDHQLDRVERMLQRCIEVDRQERKKRRAELREFRNMVSLQEPREKLSDLVDRRRAELRELRKKLGLNPPEEPGDSNDNR